MRKQIIAALALAFGSTVAFAADADKSKAEQHPPTKAVGEKAGQTPGTPESGKQAGGGEHPPTKAMDKAAAGQTEQDKAVKESQAAQDKAAGGQPSDKQQAAGQPSETGAAGRQAGGGRDWSQVDKDNNNLVSAEEMDAWLKANPGPLAQSGGAAGAAGKEGADAKKEPAAKEPAADKEKK